LIEEAVLSQPGRRRRFAGPIVLMVVLAALGPTGSAEGRNPSWTLRFTSALEFTYDNNVFLYSPERLDLFRQGQQTYRFPGVETCDDLISSPEFALDLARSFSANYAARLRARHAQHLYAVNPVKDYQSFSCSILQTIGRGNKFETSVFYLPRYYLRPIPDPDGSARDYLPCDFEKVSVAVCYERTIVRTARVGVYYRWESDDYNRYFPEYDTRIDALGLTVRQTLLGGGHVEGEIGRKTARARGFDDPGETKSSSDDPDISYDELVLKVGIEGRTGGPDRPLRLGLDYGFEDRDFTTGKDDPYHRGREDREHTVRAALDLEIGKKWVASASYSWRSRSVSAAQMADIDEIKDFENQRLSLGIERKY
jgi:hypothetical protein